MTNPHEPARPIEKGCMAIITSAPVKPEWVGRYVEVFDRCTVYEKSWDVSIWDERGNICSCQEDDLLRIDDEDPDLAIESEREKEHA